MLDSGGCGALTEGNVELGKTVLGVSLRNGVEHNRVVQDMVVEGEVTAANGSDENPRSLERLHLRRDRVDTLALDALPSLLLDLLGDGLQVLSGGLERPVGLDSLFDLSVGTCGELISTTHCVEEAKRHTDSGETQNSGCDTRHFGKGKEEKHVKCMGE